MDSWPVSLQSSTLIHTHFPIPIKLREESYYLPLVSKEEIVADNAREDLQCSDMFPLPQIPAGIFVSQRTGKKLEPQNNAFIVFYKNGKRKLAFGNPMDL